MPKMTGGEAIVGALLEHGVDTVFGLPGAQTYGLFDALQRAQPKLKVYGARHEQTCGYMAFGAARSTGKPAVYTVVPGPGLLNSSAALSTALACNAPVLCVTGQVPTAFLDRGKGHLHDLPNQLATMRTLTKWAARIERPSEAPVLVAEAFRRMLSGRRGPAALEMPWDVFTLTEEAETAAPLAPDRPPVPDPDVVQQAGRMLQAAKAPMIWVGGGAMEASAEVLELAEMLDAPVASFRSGRGIVSDEHELSVMCAAAYRLWPETDLVIGIGTRLEVIDWRWRWRPPGVRFIRVDIDPAEMERFTAHAGIVADAAAGTSALIAAARKLGVGSSGRREAIRVARAGSARVIREIQPQMGYLDAIRDVLPRDGFFVEELTQVGFASYFGFPVYRPRTYVSSGYAGNLGFGFPTALGVQAVHPGQPVVSISGDGGFLFAAADLATAAQYKLGVVSLVFNNNAFGNVRRDQRATFGGRLLGADLVNPDFVKFAESFGVAAARVLSPEELRPALERALASGEPWLIEIPIPPDSEADPWRFIHPAPP